MTGIERLHKLIADIAVRTDPELWYILRDGTEGDWDCEKHDDKTLGNTLAAIANQIEREQGGRVSRMRVLAVVTDMERHVSGVEGMEDSPVARWARELREALGGNGRDPAADISMSAYDLLPQEDREAITWVREHGGLERVKKLFDWVVGHCSTKQQLDFDFWLSGRVMYELGFEEDMADRDEVERRLLARLMPEGMEWLVEAWPRLEDGEPVGFGDEVSRLGEVFSISLYCDGSFALNFRAYSKGERVKRPAPKVLDADGVEIREGDRVWSTHLDEPHEWIVINPHEHRDDSQTVLVSIGDRTGHARPSDLTHRAPVLAADGLPLREREHVYHVETGAELVVKGLPKPGEYQAVVVFALPTSPASHLTSFDPDQLTHQRPVLDADGVPIHVGDVVWHLTDGRKHEVTGIDSIVKEIRIKDESMELGVWDSADGFTHTKPEIDTWQRVEEDAGCTATKYNERRGTIFTTKQQVARDLVSRCRALAERERGE